MFGTRSIDAVRPQVVDLTARPVPSGVCGPRFDVTAARITIMVEGQVAYEQTPPAVPFRALSPSGRFALALVASGKISCTMPEGIG